jgi:spermidine/putrescine transport system substrate-binding protein
MTIRITLFVLILLLALTACGGDAAPTPTNLPPTPSPTEEATEEATAEATEEIDIDATEEATEEAAATGETLAAWTCPSGFEGQTLSLYNWATYIGDNTVSDFEAACGVTVLYDIYDSDESMLARLRQGNPGYDVAFPTDYAVSILIREGLAAEIDLEKIPNFTNADTSFINRHFDPGNKHSVPYVWGTTAFAYNKTIVETPLESWEDFFNYEGRVAWLDVPRVMIGAALRVLGKDPNSTNPEDIEAAKQYLIEHSANVIRIAADDGDALLAQREVDAVVEYGGDIHQQLVDCECDDYVYVLPSEGAFIDITSMVLLANGPNPELAHVWMDYVLHPQVGADITNTIAYPSPNRVALEQELIDAELLTDSSVTPARADVQKMRFILDISDTEQLYNDAWDEIKVSIGQ